jgi:hypothetical protein
MARILMVSYHLKFLPIQLKANFSPKCVKVKKVLQKAQRLSTHGNVI